MRYDICSHVRPDGTRCRGWANVSGKCPMHNGRVPVKPKGKRESAPARCSCETGDAEAWRVK